MAAIQLAGLASGFDWKTFVDQLMDIERAPIRTIQTEQGRNTQRSTALGTFSTRLTSLQTAVTGLSDISLFSGRKATSSATTGAFNAVATAGSTPGSFEFAVSKLATTARREGAADLAVGLSATADVSSLTLATLATATTISAGTFSVNGQKVTVATTDSLQDVFDAIATATAGEVTAAYDPVADKVTLTGTGPAGVSLGAANDTSNLLRALKLGNNGTASVTSAGSLGTTKLNATLATAGLRAPITAVDGAGDGSFTINGVALAYNVNTDSLSTIISRINQAGAGVTASFDGVNDRLLLANGSVGNLGLAVSEPAGGLLDALGLTSGGTFVAGQDAEFRLNGGPTLTAAGNPLDATAHGIAGLSVTVDSTTTQTITVAADTDKMRQQIDAFIKAYNDVQTFVDDQTKITTTNGRVTAAILATNREVQDNARELRSLAFGTVAGLSGTVQRLESLGIDFSGIAGTLAVEDETKLTTALRDKPADVEKFFQSASTGFAAKFKATIDRFTTSLADQQTGLTTRNSTLDTQIADIERRLVQQRELLTNGFLAMEQAQSKLQSQGAALTSAFNNSNN